MDPRGLRGGRASILVSTAKCVVYLLVWMDWIGLDWMDGLLPSFAASFLERLVEYLLTCTMFFRFFQQRVLFSLSRVFA